ncbi:hypothetical protein PoB_007633900 [Plakobranchus ocellatus]|uniref:Uncharacterized protein n=1 Tax=Plakobranchus ocellatus TaxID=259542 RepID=A0AAV4E0L1_9GAST|nr:hypothetical protein PoB_007633900 [Plakobranchus ocellatus]
MVEDLGQLQEHFLVHSRQISQKCECFSVEKCVCLCHCQREELKSNIFLQFDDLSVKRIVDCHQVTVIKLCHIQWCYLSLHWLHLPLSSASYLHRLICVLGGQGKYVMFVTEDPQFGPVVSNPLRQKQSQLQQTLEAFPNG